MKQLNIALVAHDARKQELVKWCTFNYGVLRNHNLYATGTTGKLISNIKTEEDGIEEYPLSHLEPLLSGPLGGDQQIGSMTAHSELDLVIFLRDPLTSQPHEPDVSALLRLCDVVNIPLATNIASAQIMLNALGKAEIPCQKIKK